MIFNEMSEREQELVTTLARHKFYRDELWANHPNIAREVRQRVNAVTEDKTREVFVEELNEWIAGFLRSTVLAPHSSG